jgi:hypothetical protein
MTITAGFVRVGGAPKIRLVGNFLRRSPEFLVN